MIKDKEQLVEVIDFWQKSARKNNLFERTVLNAVDVKSKEIIDCQIFFLG